MPPSGTQSGIRGSKSSQRHLPSHLDALICEPHRRAALIVGEVLDEAGGGEFREDGVEIASGWVMGRKAGPSWLPA
jgi:hypothetical protein